MGLRAARQFGIRPSSALGVVLAPRRGVFVLGAAVADWADAFSWARPAQNEKSGGRGRRRNPAPPPARDPVVLDSGEHATDESLSRLLRRLFDAQRLPGGCDPGVGPAGRADEDVALVVASADAFGAIHDHTSSNRVRILRRARCIRTRTAVTLRSKRSAMTRSGTPSTSRASMISRSSGGSASSAARSRSAVLVARFFVSRSGRALGQGSFRAPPPDDVDGAADRDGADPRAEARLRPVPVERAERLEERLLRGVLGQARVAGHPASRGQGRRRGPAYEGRDRLLVALARADDEQVFLGLGRRGRRRGGGAMTRRGLSSRLSEMLRGPGDPRLPSGPSARAVRGASAAAPG